jgi:hypothetical protein
MFANRRRRDERGAVAVEFALVSPLLFVLLFGLVDYGLYFADAMSLRQATTDAAREATLSVGNLSANWPGSSTCGAGVISLDPSGQSDLAKVVCSLSDSVQPIGGGTVVAKAEIVGPDGSPTTAWTPINLANGLNHLRVCTMVRHDAVMPFVPLPGGGLITARVDMPIQPANAPLSLNPVALNPSIAGSTWSWC